MEKDGRRNWSALTSDTLVSITERLPLADIARIPAVCGGWAWSLGMARKGWPLPASPPKAAFVPLENSSPWLLLPNEEGVDAEHTDFLRLSEIQSAAPQIQISPLPEMAGRICVGGSLDGWIVTADIWLYPRILNPITREEITLPSLFTLSRYAKMNPIYFDKGNGCMNKVSLNNSKSKPSYSNFEYKFIQKIILSSAPPHGISFLIYGHVFEAYHLTMARVGDLAWIPVLDDQKICDVVHDQKDDKYYILSYLNKIFILDLKNYHWGSSQPHEAIVVYNTIGLPFFPEKKYVAFSTNGDLLMAWRHYKSITKNNLPYPRDYQAFSFEDYEADSSPLMRTETFSIKIFKFVPEHYDCGHLVASWVHVKDLGDDAMFLGLNHSTCISTLDKPWLKRNSVYFLEDMLFSKISSERHYASDGGIFDLEDNTFERLFPTHSKVNWPPPAWFMSSQFRLIL